MLQTTRPIISLLDFSIIVVKIRWKNCIQMSSIQVHETHLSKKEDMQQHIMQNKTPSNNIIANLNCTQFERQLSESFISYLEEEWSRMEIHHAQMVKRWIKTFYLHCFLKINNYFQPSNNKPLMQYSIPPKTLKEALQRREPTIKHHPCIWSS